MTLIMVDSFEFYVNGLIDYPRVWTARNGFDSGWATSPVRTGTRSLYCNNSGEFMWKQVNPSDEHATFIAGVGFYRNSADDTEVINFVSDSGNTSHVSCNVDTNGAIRVTRGGRTGTTLGTSVTGLVPPSTWHYIEFKATLSDTVGVAVVRVDNTQVLNLTSQDTKNAGTKTVFDRVYVGQVSSGGSVDCFIDDFYFCNGAGSVNNDLLGECRVRTLYATGNGAVSQGVGSDADSVNNYALINDTIPGSGSATYVDLVNTNDEDTYAFADLPDTSGSVAGVQISTYAQKSDTGSRTLAHVTRIGSTDYPSSNLPIGAGSFAWQATVRETNPATSTAFTRADVNAAEFGVRAT